MRSFFYLVGLSKRQALEDCFRDMFHSSHDVTPNFRRVEDVGRTAFECSYDIAGDALGIGKARGIGHVVGHRSLHRPRLNRNDADAGGMKAAAEPLQEKRQSALGRTVDVVRTASAISGNGGDGSQASGMAALQIGGEQCEDRGRAHEVDLQFFEQNVDGGFGILLLVHRAVSQQHGVELGERALGKIEDRGVLLYRR